MHQITLNNLVPPGKKQYEISDRVIAESLFRIKDEPSLMESVHQSPFFKPTKGTLTLEDRLKHNADRKYVSVLFSQPSYGSCNRYCSNISNILFIQTTDQNNRPYTYESYPFRKALKSNWKTILDELQKDELCQFLSHISALMFDPTDMMFDPTDMMDLDDISSSINTRLNDSTSGCIDLLKKYSVDYDIQFYDEDGSVKSLTNFPSGLKKVWTKLPNNEAKKILVNTIADETVRSKLIAVLDNNFPFKLFDLNKAFSQLLEKYPLRTTDDQNTQVENLSEILSTLSLIGLTYTFWVCGKDHERDILSLAKLIFPSDISQGLVFTSHVSDSIPQPLSEIGNNDDAEATETLKKARDLMSQMLFKEAGKLLESAIQTFYFAPLKIRAEMLYLLSLCCKQGYIIPTSFGSIKNIEKQAYYWGCEKVSPPIEDILNSPERATDKENGICIINTTDNYSENSIIKCIIQTMPSNWDVIYSSDPVHELNGIKTARFILISDNYSVNVKHALQLFDAIKRSVSEHKTSMSDWNKTEIFIRCDEEKVSSLLDTALSFLPDTTDGESMSSILHVYLIDDKKRAAQLLLANHGLHYPLTMLGNIQNTSQKHVTVLNFVIISNNVDTTYVSWLVREAFWMMPITEQSIISKISVISPIAVSIGLQINANCPGLEKFSTYIKNGVASKPVGYEDIVIDDINFPTIEYRNTSFETNALWSEIEKIEESNNYLYYAIDSTSDTESVNLATKIREKSIRCAVKKNKIKSYSRKYSIVAFRCEDSDYARLSQGLLIPKENEKANNQWFNNYNLLSWGTVKDIYSWENLSGGPIEKLSQCIHLQYCGVSTTSTADDKKYKKGLATYFYRLYNRDSSFASAMSFPGRLYAADIIPIGWFIQDKNAFWGTAQRETLADIFNERYNESENKEALQEKLEKYEHARWCLYMLSRGYLPGNKDGGTNETVNYMNAGAPRHVLQIARLHPCICSWEQLKHLHERLYFEYESTGNDQFKKYTGEENYFTSMDQKNIEKTADLLRLSWFSHSKEIPEKSNTGAKERT